MVVVLPPEVIVGNPHRRMRERVLGLQGICEWSLIACVQEGHQVLVGLD